MSSMRTALLEEHYPETAYELAEFLKLNDAIDEATMQKKCDDLFKYAFDTSNGIAKCPYCGSDALPLQKDESMVRGHYRCRVIMACNGNSSGTCNARMSGNWELSMQEAFNSALTMWNKRTQI